MIQRQGLLPERTFDIAAVLVEDGKVAKLDVKRIELRKGVVTTVSLDVGGSE